MSENADTGAFDGVASLSETDMLARAIETGFAKCCNPMYSVTQADMTDFVMYDLPRVLRAAQKFIEVQALIHAYQETDCTSYPYWAIVVKGCFGKQNLLAGPFFSREAAEQDLKLRRYNYPAKAFTFCFSGNASEGYRKLFETTKPREKWYGFAKGDKF